MSHRDCAIKNVVGDSESRTFWPRITVKRYPNVVDPHGRNPGGRDDGAFRAVDDTWKGADPGEKLHHTLRHVGIYLVEVVPKP